MNREEITSKVTTILENNGVVFVGAENLTERMQIDSIQFVTAVIDIENEFDIEIPDEYLLVEEFSDISKIADIIMQYSSMDNDVCVLRDQTTHDSR